MPIDERELGHQEVTRLAVAADGGLQRLDGLASVEHAAVVGAECRGGFRRPELRVGLAEPVAGNAAEGAQVARTQVDVTSLLVFHPAEDGAAAEERGGARLALAQLPLDRLAADRVPEDVADREHEVGVVDGEVRHLPGVGAEHAPGRILGTDAHAHAADHAVVAQQRRTGEARLHAQVAADDRPGAAQRIAALGLDIGGDHGRPDQTRSPADAGEQPQLAPPGHQAQHLHQGDFQRRRDHLHGPLAERLRRLAGQRRAAEGGDGSLLALAQRQAPDRPLDPGHVGIGHDDALDPLFRGAKRRNAAHVPGLAVLTDLALDRHQRPQYRPGVAEELRIRHPWDDVAERAAEIALAQGHQPDSSRREPADAQPLVQKQRRHLRAGEQVGEVVGGRLQLSDLLGELLVDRGELLVHRAQLRARAFQLVVRAAQLLVGRDGLLAGDLELFVGALQLVDRPSQALAGRVQRQGGGGRALGAFRRAATGCRIRVRALDEAHQEQRPLGGILVRRQRQRLHAHLHRHLGAVPPPQRCRPRHGFPAPVRLSQGVARRRSEGVDGQPAQLQARLAARQGQIVLHRPMQISKPSAGVGDHRSGRECVHQRLRQGAGQIPRQCARGRHDILLRAADAAGGRSRRVWLARRRRWCPPLTHRLGVGVIGHGGGNVVAHPAARRPQE